MTKIKTLQKTIFSLKNIAGVALETFPEVLFTFVIEKKCVENSVSAIQHIGNSKCFFEM